MPVVDKHPEKHPAKDSKGFIQPSLLLGLITVQIWRWPSRLGPRASREFFLPTLIGHSPPRLQPSWTFRTHVASILQNSLIARRRVIDSRTGKTSVGDENKIRNTVHHPRSSFPRHRGAGRYPGCMQVRVIPSTRPTFPENDAVPAIRRRYRAASPFAAENQFIKRRRETSAPDTRRDTTSGAEKRETKSLTIRGRTSRSSFDRISR